MPGPSGYFNPNTGTLTPDERAYMLQELPDLTEQEEQLARMRGYSDTLRGQTAPVRGRMDVGSQAARALSGIGAGLANKRAMEMGTGLGDSMRRFGMNWPGAQSGNFLKDRYRQSLEATPGQLSGIDTYG